MEMDDGHTPTHSENFAQSNFLSGNLKQDLIKATIFFLVITCHKALFFLKALINCGSNGKGKPPNN